jgi:hypothetical protein
MLSAGTKFGPIHVTRQGVIATPKFMGVHSLPPGSMTRQQIDQLARCAQEDPVVKGYRSFCSLAEGKAVCILGHRSPVIVSWHL